MHSMARVARTRPALGRAVVLALGIALVAGGCSGSPRPDVAEWRTAWLGVVDGIPDIADVEAATSRDLCSATLAMLRSRSGELSPTPDLAIDDTVRNWIEVAEDAFFECPPRGGEIDSFAAAYAELERLEAEVAVVLDLDE